jgi:hypothetical protein
MNMYNKIINLYVYWNSFEENAWIIYIYLNFIIKKIKYFNILIF